ncbi:MAG: group II intron maturase-specific domain-containing protein [Chthoniobacterales bacterium]
MKLHRFLENGLTGKISQKTDRKTCGRDTEEVIGELNLMLKGWANYFQLGVV